MKKHDLELKYFLDREEPRHPKEVAARAKALLNSGKTMTKSSEARLLRTLGLNFSVALDLSKPGWARKKYKEYIEKAKSELKKTNDPEIKKILEQQLKTYEEHLKKLNESYKKFGKADYKSLRI